MPDNTSGNNGQMAQIPGGQGGITPPEGMEMPERMENIFHGQNGNSQDRVPNIGQGGSAPTQGSSHWVLLAATLVILAAGLLVAFKYKR